MEAIARLRRIPTLVRAVTGSLLTSRPSSLTAALLLALAVVFLAIHAKRSSTAETHGDVRTNVVKAAAPPGAPNALPGMPRIPNRDDIYTADRPGNLSPVVRNYPARIYVPNSRSNSVTVIDPATYTVIDQFRVAAHPQHVTPSYDLKTLWVLSDEGNSLTRIDPATGKPVRTNSSQRSLQYVLHARRKIRHRGSGTPPTPELS